MIPKENAQNNYLEGMVNGAYHTFEMIQFLLAGQVDEESRFKNNERSYLVRRPTSSQTPNAEKQCKITGDSHNRGDRPTASEQRRGEEATAAVQLDRRRKCNMA